jgi:HSP20 family protein
MLARINRNYVPAYWDDFFNDRVYNNNSPAPRKNISPAVNIIEADNDFRIEVAVPGLTRNDFNIEVEDDVLTISSVEKETQEEKLPNYTRREFNFSSFKRSFQLPETIDQDQIQASHKEGVLSITLVKKEEEVQNAPKQIEVK